MDRSLFKFNMKKLLLDINSHSCCFDGATNHLLLGMMTHLLNKPWKSASHDQMADGVFLEYYYNHFDYK